MKKLLILLAAMLALQLAAASDPPWVNNASILPAPAYRNSTLQGWCNASDNDSTVLSLNYTWLNGTAVYSVGHAPPFICFQDQANVSTSCGGLASGSYLVDTSISGYDISASIDGNTATSPSQSPQLTEGFYVNYTIPVYILNATWSIKSIIIGTRNTTIPSSCIRYPTLVLKILTTNSGGAHGNSTAYCYNGSAWDNISLQTVAIYEESIYWGIGAANVSNNTNTLVANVSQNTANKYENWTFACTAYDGSASSPNTMSYTVNISSAPPVITSPNIINTTIYLGQTATANWTFSDIDGDSDTSYYAWYLNDTVNQQGQFAGTVPSFTNFNATGDTIVLSIMGNDGTVNSTVWVNSSTYTVQDPELNMTVNSLTAFNQTMGKNKTISFMLSLINNASTTLEYNITDNRNATFVPSISYNTTLFNVTGSSATAINVTLNSSNITGTQYFNLTLTRLIDNHQTHFLVGITVVAQSASISFTPTAIWTAGAYTTTGMGKTFNVTNTDYNASNCSFSTPGSINAYIQSHTFNISNETKEITVTIPTPAVGIYTGTLTLTCTNATDTGASVSAPVGIDYLFIVQAPYTPTGGGGGSTSTAKKTCFIKLSKDSLTVSDDTKLDTLYIKNSEPTAYIPSVTLSDTVKPYLRYTLAPSIIRAEESGELSILLSASNVSALGELVLTDATCEDITVPIALNSGGQISFYLLDYLLQPLFSIAGVTVYNWYVLVIAAILGFLMLDALIPAWPLGTKWAAALVLAAFTLAVVNLDMVKTWISTALS